MAIELFEGEVELKRIKEKDIEWVEEQTVGDRGNGPEILYVRHRDHPQTEGQRWVYDRGDDLFDKNRDDHEWVLVGPAPTTEDAGGRKWLRATRS